MKEDAVYVRHIAECISGVETNTANGLAEFLSSRTIQDATLRNLQTMSEATQRLSDTVKSKHPNVQWQRISAFRNVLVHNYLGIDLELIWKVIQEDLPELKRAISAMLEGLPHLDD
ncbi:MAG: DUF86 domain-containing protein [Acidobacteria bacterium]|nr:DUF86 domain-containing protein [Acidobacteriota bacterium]